MKTWLNPDYKYWFWYELRIAALKRDGACVYCRKELDKYTIKLDHYIPISKGGLSELSNLVAACRTCDQNKADKLPLDFIMERVDHE